MTRAEEVYASTLNLLGSDVLDPELQSIVDDEHALLDHDFKLLLDDRRKSAQSTAA